MARRSYVLMAMIAAVLGLAWACSGQQFVCGEFVQGVKAVSPAYDLGECVAIEYTIQNNTNQTITYTFPSSMNYDVWVTRGGSEEVYRMSRGKAYLAMVTSMTLKPGDKRTFSAQWNQKDSSGKQIGPGAYTLCAQLTPSGKRPAVTLGRVRIGGRGAALVPVKIKQAVSGFISLEGKRVRISATYRGFSPTSDANIKDGPPVTRSDWAICDGTGCMYAVGRIDLDPTRDIGKSVTVVGKLAKGPHGQVYMVVDTATVEKQKSRACPK